MKKYKIFYLIASLFLLTPIFAGQKPITGHRYYQPLITDGEGRIYFLKHETNGYWDIWRIDEDGKNLLRLTKDPMIETRVDLFPDKTKLAVIKISKDFKNFYIYTMNSDGSDAKQIYSTSEYIDDIKVSPDGKKIAFIEKVKDDDYGSIFVMNIDGSNVRTLAPHIAGQSIKKLFYGVQGSTNTKNLVSFDGNICFSSDSTRISFITSERELAIINIDGSNLTKSGGVYLPKHYWSKSGEIIGIDSEDNLRLFDVENNSWSVLYSTSSGITLNSFSVSPDEKRVVLELFDYNQGGVMKLVILSSTTPQIVKEFKDVIPFDSLCFWSSNKKICFTDYRDIYVTDDGENANKTNLTNNDDLPSSNTLIDAKENKVVYYCYIGRNINIYSMDTDGSNKILLLSYPFEMSEAISRLKLSPDGKWFIYISTDVKQLYIKSTSGGSEILVDQTTASDEWYSGDPVWSPDSKKFFFVKNQSPKYYIYIYDVEKSSKIVIPHNISVYSVYNGILFSPNSKEIIFVISSSGSDYICKSALTDISTYTVVFSTDNGNRISLLDWKKDKILLSKRFGDLSFYYNLYLINQDGSGLKEIVTNLGNVPYAKLSPNGDKVVYQINEVDEKGLLVFNIENNEKIKLKNSYEYSLFDFSKDNKKIAYLGYIYEGSEQLGVYISNLDDLTNTYQIAPWAYLSGDPKFVANNKIVYMCDLDIWCGDYTPELDIPLPKDIVVPEEKGEIKVVVTEGAGEKGTINPKKGKPVVIGFKGKEAGSFSLKIFTQFGELVYQTTQNFSSSEGWFEWIPKENLATGVYVVYIEGPGVKMYKKIAILK